MPYPERVDASEPVAAAYSGACVAGIVPALLTGHPHDPLPDWIPGPVHGARTVVVLVLWVDDAVPETRG